MAVLAATQKNVYPNYVLIINFNSMLLQSWHKKGGNGILKFSFLVQLNACKEFYFHSCSSFQEYLFWQNGPEWEAVRGEEAVRLRVARAPVPQQQIHILLLCMLAILGSFQLKYAEVAV